MNNTGFTILDEVKRIYAQGSNIIDYVNSRIGSKENTEEAILISYEFQAGSYIKQYYEDETGSLDYASHIAAEIGRYHSFADDPNALLMEAGVGESTTQKDVIINLNARPENCYGFDLSWSRINVAKKFLSNYSLGGVNLNTGNLFRMPYADDSIDIVYTAHSLEPNGGREEEGLRELYRVTKKYLLLFEPGYELADLAARERMERLGYVRKLYSTAKALGYKIVEHKLLGFSKNPLNPTSVLVVEKNNNNSGGGGDPALLPAYPQGLIAAGADIVRKRSLPYVSDHKRYFLFAA